MSQVRMQLELPEDRVAQLKQIMEVCGMATQKELFNNALSLFEWAVRQRQSGRTVASIDEEGQRFRELTMPVLEHVRTATEHIHPAVTRSMAR